MLKKLLTINNKNNTNLSTLVNPFKKDGIEKIVIHMFPTPISWCDDNKHIYAKIYFNKNNTSGGHEVYGNTLDEIINLIKATIDEL